MQARFSREARDEYWDELTERFPRSLVDWSIDDGQSPGPEMKHGTSILSCLYSLDGAHIIAAGGGCIPGCDTAIRIWDTDSGRERLVCNGHVCGIYELALHPRTGFLASASEDYSVVLWNLERRDNIFLVGGDPIVKQHVGFNNEGNLIAIGEGEAYEDFVSAVFVIDLDTAEEIFRHRLKRGYGVSAMAISPDGKRLIFSVQEYQARGDTELSCWDIIRVRREWRYSFRDTTFAELHFLPGERSIAAAVWTDEETSVTLSGAFILDAMSGQVQSRRLLEGIGINLSASFDGRQLAAAHSERGIELLQLPDLTPTKALTDFHEKNCFSSVRFSADGKVVLAGDPRGMLRKFDVAGPAFAAPASFKVPTLPDPPPRVMPLSSDLLSLLQAAKESPAEDAPRLLLAQYLEQNGDPRGEFVRLQCALTKLEKDEPCFGSFNRGRSRRLRNEPGAPLESRESELLTRFGDEWLGPLAECADACEFHRGLLQVHFKPKQFFARAMLTWLAELSATWLDGIALYNVTAREVDRLADLSFLENLTVLSLSGKIGVTGVARLCASPHLGRIRELDLGASELGEAGARALADSPLLSQLTSLKLGGNEIGDKGLEALLASLIDPRLMTLEVQANRITQAGASILGGSAQLARLARLDLGNNYLCDAGVRALATSPHLTKLQSLSLFFTAVGSEGATALAASPYLANVQELDLAANGSLQESEGGARLRDRFGTRVRF